jgi:tRNA modification GTPase
LANPGEFTLRAFLNGRIDLAQAEAVLDIVQARTQASLRLAVQGLEGRLSTAVRKICENLMSTLAYLTARIDFPEDEIEKQNFLQPMTDALGELKGLIVTADSGIIYRNGIRTAIVGRPNVGKSSLLNQLLKQDRAIVTSIPGTTRDTIEETVNIQGIPFMLIDTAGIIHSKELVESLGIERSRRSIEQADLVLLVLDTSEPMTDADRQIIEAIGNISAIIVANKCDLPQQANLEGPLWDTVFTSALTGEGISDLEEQMVRTVLGGSVSTSDALLVSNPRHKSLLEQAERYLQQAIGSAENSMPDDFVTIDLTAALNTLGEITGDTVQEELLETIFSNFCIGK